MAYFRRAGGLWGAEVMELWVAYVVFRLGRVLVCVYKMKDGVYRGVDRYEF